MSAGYLRPQTRVLAASGTFPFLFNLAEEPFCSIQVVKADGGKTDVSFVLFASNFVGEDVPGYQATTSGTWRGDGPLSGSAYNGYWSRQAAGNDLLTGSVQSDPVGSAMIHLTGTQGVRCIRLDVSSGWGGTVTVMPHRKS